MPEVSHSTDLERANREISQLREELRETKAEAARTREEARQRLQNFAREFRVPLTAVLGFSDVLSATDKSHRSELNQIAIAGHELMELIENLELPVAETPARKHQVKDVESLAPVVHTVLHIEDNETNFRLTERILEDRPNIESLWAKTGQEGIDLACKHSPALILLDLNLPDIHGSDLLVRVRNNPLTAQIPVIVLSADASPSRIERMLQAGARNYLTKPFDIKRLLCLVDETLESAAQPRLFSVSLLGKP
jgi:CheY-like chemotaxis protein